MIEPSTTTPQLDELALGEGGSTRTKWFSEIGCVVEDGEERQVFVGGVLIGRFDVSDTGTRNVLLVNLLANGRQRVGRLAKAFGIGESTLGDIRRRYQEGGLEALVRVHKPPRSKPKLDAKQRRALEKEFEKGKRVVDILEYAEKKYGIKRATLYSLHKEWRKRLEAEKHTKRGMPTTTTESGQAEFELRPRPEPEPRTKRDSAPGESAEPSTPEGIDSSRSDGVDIATTSEPTADDAAALTPEAPTTCTGDAPLDAGTTLDVQHAGTWLMLAALMQLGLYDVLSKAAVARQLSTKSLRLVLDALVVALSLGERCVEGVRRIATPTANVLLRAKSAPSAQWVRQVLGRVAEAYVEVQDAMTKRYLELAGASETAVFYVDNHMRPYTGKHTVRKGWRMQDKRVRPGTSDYYVHDLDGRPVLRVTEPSHGHLTDFMRPLAEMLRRALGKGVQVVLAFDRGGAFPAEMAKLRNAGVHFVTYERKPYPILSPSVFAPDGIVRIGKNVYTIYEKRRTNLGKGRGRVRRIMVLTPDARQVNLLAVSTLPAKELLTIMLGRWNQENGFKHGIERWGINQLDGRTVVHYEPDTVIPNPARRRLDAAIRIARTREGDARRKLGQLAWNNPRRAQLEQEIADAMSIEEELLELRPSAPKYIELKDSELAGELVHHAPEYKGLIDSVRIACANVENQLAAMLAPALARPREAKKVLANLFAAPGTIRVSQRNIRVTLTPAATNAERRALERFVEQLDAAELVLPGDTRNRCLRFRIAK